MPTDPHIGIQPCQESGSRPRQWAPRSLKRMRLLPRLIAFKQIFSKAVVWFHMRSVHPDITLPDADGRGVHTIGRLCQALSPRLSPRNLLKKLRRAVEEWPAAATPGKDPAKRRAHPFKSAGTAISSRWMRRLFRVLISRGILLRFLFLVKANYSIRPLIPIMPGNVPILEQRFD